MLPKMGLPKTRKGLPRNPLRIKTHPSRVIPRSSSRQKSTRRSSTEIGVVDCVEKGSQGGSGQLDPRSRQKSTRRSSTEIGVVDCVEKGSQGGGGQLDSLPQGRIAGEKCGISQR
jgi:hypothetical protein